VTAKKAPNSPQKKRPRTGGRKPILDPQLVAAALVELSGNIHAVARKFGVDRSAVRQLIDKHPQLDRVLTDARAGMTDNVISRFYSDCLKDSPHYQTSRIFYLKTQAGWRERDERERDTAAVDAFLGVLLRAAGGGPKAVEGGAG
jgi:hypothetical protein